MQSIYAAMRRLGLYALTGETLVDCELMACDTAFSSLEGLLDDIERQAFVQTASGEGLLRHEALVGLGYRAGLSEEQRRGLVIYRRSVASTDFTVVGMLRSMRASGIDAELIENKPHESITITNNTFLDEFDSLDGLKLRLSEMLPAHLDWEFDTGLLTWDMFDAINPEWDAWDGRDFTWDEFDIDGHNILNIGG